jgi:hypothetical protein
MKIVNVFDFGREVDCIYDAEKYSVRDNGAVLRHHRAGKNKRVLDNQWTFGKQNSANPYLSIAGVRIHRIVATAFHGEPPDPKYVVDHIDSNCRNNRPENLQWLTRLENALKNPATRKKIEYHCGSIDAYLDNPSILHDIQSAPNISWMRAVTPEEARNCKMRMDVWANSYSKPRSTSRTAGQANSFGDRVLKPLQKWEVGLDREPGLDFALTPWCAQYMWRAPMNFPLRPQRRHGHSHIEEYFKNIKAKSVFACSDHQELCPTLTAVESVLRKDGSSILVMTHTERGNWVIGGIELCDRSQHFIHFGLGSYSSKHEAGIEFTSKELQCDFWSAGYGNYGGYS